MKKLNINDIKEKTLEYFNNDSLSADVWIRKYSLKDSDGNYYELSPKDMHERLSSEFSRIENKYPNSLSKEKIFELLDKFKYIVPQGSPMSGIGNNFQVVSISNCFVVGNEYDSYGGILHTDQEQIQLMKRRGGVGHDLSHIRPKGSPVKNSALTSTGVVPFMERYSNSTREVAQDGRRGALMLSISITHPDAEDFIDAKMTPGKITGANVSVKIDDDFMEAINNKDVDNSYYIQKYPVDMNPLDHYSKDEWNNLKEELEFNELHKVTNGVYVKKIDPVAIWSKIVQNVWSSAEPGLLFWDTIRRESPADSYGKEWKTASTNPCFPASEHILTKDGYLSFGDGYKYAKPLKIIADGRVSYKDDGKEEKPENWKIDISKSNTVLRESSPVMLTQPMAEVIQIKTKNGYTVKLTPDHLVATKRGMIEAQNLTIEDEILIAIPESGKSIIGKLPETEEEISSMLIGLISGDGTFDKKRKRVHLDFWGDDKERMKDIVLKSIDKLYEIKGDIYNSRNRKLSKYFITYNEESDKLRISSAWLAEYLEDKYDFKRETKFNVPKFIYNKSRTNIGKFYLAAMFYCDASVQGSKKSGYTIRLAQSNESFLVEIQKIAHSNGILFGIYKRRNAQKRNLPDGKGGYKLYNTKTQYELISIFGGLTHYRDFIGFLGDPIKEEKMRVEHNFKISNSHYDSIIETIKLEPEPVYCVKEDIGRNIIVNGLTVKRCGEIPLNPYDSCRLLAINLYSYVENPFTDKAIFNFELFKEHVRYAQRLSDDIIDLELEKVDQILDKIKSDPEPEHIKRIEIELWEKIKDNATNGRRTGLGITGEGDMLAALGYTYGSDESIEFSELVHKTKAIEAYKESVNMAKERGAFPVFDIKKDVNSDFIKRITEADHDLSNEMEGHGRRNISILTIAPTGSTSLMTQTSSGIEPVFLVYYKRRRKINPQEKDVRVDFVDEVGDSWTEYNVFHHNFLTWAKVNGYDIEELKSMPEDEINKIVEKSPFYKATSNDVDWVQKVKLQGKVQKWIDHSISVTVNLPEDIKVEKVSEIYKKAHEYGCKGVTIYRDGSRSGVLVKADKKDENKKGDEKFDRPNVLPCDIHHVQANRTKFYVIVGLLNDQPYEIFAFAKKQISIPQLRKEGKLIKVDSGVYNLKYNGTEIENLAQHFQSPEEDGFTRMVSLLLRRGIPVKDVVAQLEKSYSNISSFYKVISRTLKKNYMSDEDIIENGGKKCTECGSENLAVQEGCLVCLDCGGSKCG